MGTLPRGEAPHCSPRDLTVGEGNAVKTSAGWRGEAHIHRGSSAHGETGGPAVRSRQSWKPPGVGAGVGDELGGDAAHFLYPRSGGQALLSGLRPPLKAHLTSVPQHRRS